MATTLVSPGVSVPVIDESFYIPASAPTVPLLFVATRANKMQPDNMTPAAGTQESGVVRTVTSIGQSVQLYGIPYFWADESGNPFHGDARNEYGLFALNEFLVSGSLAYVVRANVDLTDGASTFLAIGTPVADTPVRVGVGNGTISSITATSVFVKPQTIDVVFNTSTTFTVESTYGIIGSGTVGTPFTSTQVNFTITAGSTPFSGDDYFQFDLVYAPTSFTGTGNGTMTGLLPDTSAVAETWTVTMSAAGSTGPIVTVGSPTGGTLYTNGTYTNVPLTGGSGTGAKATVVVASGAVTSVTITNSGSGYVVGDNLSALATNLGGTGSGFAVTVATLGSTGFTVSGTVSGVTATGTVGTLYDNTKLTFTINAGTTAFHAGDVFTATLTTINLFNPLGANDAAKRVTITEALEAAINLNSDVRSENYEYNLILCPGYWEVAEALLSLNDSINDEAFVIADTPSNLTPDQTTAWAQTVNRATSTNIAYYYPWGLADNLDGNPVFVAPSGIALSVYTFSDNQSYVWFAPAGISRGTVDGIDDIGYVTGTMGTATTFVECYLNQGQRDELYTYYVNINPICFFPGRGIVVWGQKTSSGATSALDRVNVVRLLCYIKRQLRKGAMPFVFEPNDSITQGNLKGAADGFLNQIMAQRGLYDFVTLCNASNNPPTQVEEHNLNMAVAISPEISAEFIYIPITVVATGTTLSS